MLRGLSLFAQADLPNAGDTGVQSGSVIVGLIILIIILAFHFAPWMIALARGHHNTVPIFLVNLFFGWSCLGWVIALIWAFTNPHPSHGQNVYVNTSYSGPGGVHQHGVPARAERPGGCGAFILFVAGIGLFAAALLWYVGGASKVVPELEKLRERFGAPGERKAAGVPRELPVPHPDFGQRDAGDMPAADDAGAQRQFDAGANDRADDEPAPVRETAAAKDLDIAKRLDRSGKLDIAVTAYQAVIANYPGTPEAAAAKERLKALAP